MQPYQYLQSVAQQFDQLDQATLDRVLDELEYLFDALDPELQPLCSELISKVRMRLGLDG